CRMRGLFSVTLLLVLVLVLVLMAGKHEKSRPASECSTAETQYGKCVPEDGDCGDGLREATCKDHTDKIHCRIPCNWKKDISKTHT
uniref:Midkine n=1 Tax=Seriola lalandi dorsalis TaxID=1841481 RepID=A0A3B4XGH2_SERLL